LINANGEILTNNHVIEDAELIEVQLDDGRRFGASVIGRDPRVDVALLHLKAPGVALSPAPLGDSDPLDVGDWVLAIGCPFGLTQTVTVGIVSAKGRTGQDVPLDPAGYYSFIQTDASINPGNSGGPLLNTRGEVVGINTAVNRSGQGIGFAIPINMISTILPQLREHGRVIRSWLGISIREIDEHTRIALGLPDTHGALVFDVDPTGPARRAGVQPGDIIRQFDAADIHNSGELSWLTSTAGIGHHATLHVRRGGAELDLAVVLAAMPEAPPAPRGMVPTFPYP
jgi:serine protease Do